MTVLVGGGGGVCGPAAALCVADSYRHTLQVPAPTALGSKTRRSRCAATCRNVVGYSGCVQTVPCYLDTDDDPSQAELTCCLCAPDEPESASILGCHAVRRFIAR